MYLPPPKPAKRARVFKRNTRFGPCWFGVRIGATRPYPCNSWDEAFKFATNFADIHQFYREQGQRVRFHIEVKTA